MSSALQAVVQRDRVIVLSGLLALTLLTWWYMAAEARSMVATGVCKCFGLQMSGPDMTRWGVVELIALFLMWSEMMVAMMAPTAAPMILTFAAVNRRRREQQRPFVPTAIFLLGYLAVWSAFSLIAALGQWLLHSASLLSSMMSSTSTALGGGILIAAGVFQFTSLKRGCLIHCRSPLTFMMCDWREGRAGAFQMGVKHGVYCTGCCWLLMAVLFVTGVMNLVWIALISGAVLAEKVVPHGIWFSRVTGLGLILWGLWMLVR